MNMDSTYSGAYGRLKVSRSEFLSPTFVDQLSQKDSDEFLKQLSTTDYRREIDALSALYTVPDIVEVVLNAHMMRMIKNATFAIPALAKDFVTAYISKWDIENIKIILSSKVLGYTIENTEIFLTVQRGTPVGLFGGTISREEYVKIIEQKDIEGVVNALVKYGYGTLLLKFIDEAKKNNDVSQMILALDIFYYSRLLQSFKFYNGDEGPMLEYVKGLIDIRNVMTIIKGMDYGYKNLKDYYIKGGTISESKFAEMASKDLNSLKSDMPFNVDDAFERYKTDKFISYFEFALKRELYKKYLKLFDSLSSSLESIIGFVIRSEIERDELRAIWLSKYYKISKERTDGMRLLKYVIS
jgi:V/A-type H+/Na+-transporting ATPase subunit C